MKQAYFVVEGMQVKLSVKVKPGSRQEKIENSVSRNQLLQDAWP